MISVVVPTLNAERHLAAGLSALVHAAVEGLVREVVVVDGGSSDRTTEIVDQAGATLVKSTCGRGTQLALGAEHTRLPWILFLHADTVLEPGWEREAAAFIEAVDTGRRRAAAAVFRFALDEPGFKARLVEWGVSVRCALLRLPYGDQGLLIPRRLYGQLGGYRQIPLMEDVDLIRRLGRSRTVMLRSRAITSATRYRRDGYLRRILRNLSCLTLYYLRVPAHTIARLYR